MLEQKTPINFTDIEIKIICLCCEDYSNKEIAHRLLLNERKVRKYLKDIIRAMNKKNEAGLVLYAVENGIYKL